MPPPDRWDAYSPMGKVIPGTKFIAFKVPLKEVLLKPVAEKDKFTPAILISKLGEEGLLLTGVIDLTYTWKYYSKEDFTNKSVDHKKVFTKGHEVPSDAVFKEFVAAVETFDKHDNLIGVHCTHGVNRTGYLICRYMIEMMNMEPDDSIQLFNTARGHNIERENYIDDLKRRKSGVLSWGLVPTPSEEVPHGKKKPRWRHNRADHPNWRQKNREGEGGEPPYPPAPTRTPTGQWRRGNPSHCLEDLAGHFRDSPGSGSSSRDSERSQPRDNYNHHVRGGYSRASHPNNSRGRFNQHGGIQGRDFRDSLWNQSCGRFNPCGGAHGRDSRDFNQSRGRHNQQGSPQGGDFRDSQWIQSKGSYNQRSGTRGGHYRGSHTHHSGWDQRNLGGHPADQFTQGAGAVGCNGYNNHNSSHYDTFQHERLPDLAVNPYARPPNSLSEPYLLRSTRNRRQHNEEGWTTETNGRMFDRHQNH